MMVTCLAGLVHRPVSEEALRSDPQTPVTCLRDQESFSRSDHRQEDVRPSLDQWSMQASDLCEADLRGSSDTCLSASFIKYMTCMSDLVKSSCFESLQSGIAQPELSLLRKPNFSQDPLRPVLN